MKNIKKKGKLHPKNPHSGQYDFKILTKILPELKSFIRKNPRGEDTIDFSDSKAVVLLNKAILKSEYDIVAWDIPAGFLCPPIPGRADYIHYIADLLGDKKENAKVLDIGTGANCIYPILGSRSYNWDFVASDIDPKSISNAKAIVSANANIKDKIKLKLQEDKHKIFDGVIEESDNFDLTMCNPPFHASLEDAMKANKRKVTNLNKNNKNSKTDKNIKEGLNFGGQKAELWCSGGERLFLKKMAKESVKFSSQVRWFTSLVSNVDNISPTEKVLKKLGAKCKILEMTQGQKISRVLAWTFR